MRYTPDRNGMRGLLDTPRMQKHLLDRAEIGKRWVQSRAPVRTGGYLRGITTQPNRSPKGDRVGAKLAATDPKSAAVEYTNTGSRGLLRSAIPIMEGRAR